ncbi:MAG TPA: hypothetical protein VGL11_09620 [Candidatus Binatia bacterium]|jgi:hypothetical protein
MIRTKLLVSALAIAGAILFAAGEVRAQFTVTPAFSAPRTCSGLPLGKTGTVTIQAGPGATQFPKQAPCPDGNGTCLQWEYEWDYFGVNPSHTLLTAPSGLEIITIPDPDTLSGSPIVNGPGVADSTFKIGGKIFEVRTLRYNAHGTNFRGSYFTRSTGVGIGNITAGADSGSTTAFCAIAGPTDTGETTQSLAPLAAAECKVSGDASFSILRGKDSCIQQLTAFTDTACTVGGTPITGEALAQGILFTGPLAGNDLCPETLTVSTGSPCKLYQTTSGGITYKWCYNLANTPASLTATINCIQHINECAP